VLCSSWAADAARLLRQDNDIRILAIGDSITEGAVPSKNLNHPYTIQLEQHLRKMRPNARITVDNEGRKDLHTQQLLSCVTCAPQAAA
jgi:hypothetical protein